MLIRLKCSSSESCGADRGQPCISVDREGDQFKIWKFYCICKKRAAEFIPGVSFNVGSLNPCFI